MVGGATDAIVVELNEAAIEKLLEEGQTSVAYKEGMPIVVQKIDVEEPEPEPEPDPSDHIPRSVN